MALLGRWVGGGEATGSPATDTSYYYRYALGWCTGARVYVFVCMYMCGCGHVCGLSGIAFFALMNRTFGTTRARAHILHYIIIYNIPLPAYYR